MSGQNSVTGIITILIAILVAIWLGIGVANQQSQTVIYVLAVAGLVVCLMLGQKIWLLLVFFMTMQIPIIRGIDTMQLGQMLLVGFSLLLFLMRRLQVEWKFTELDIWRLILMGCIFQVYVRNPVGLNVLGSGSVGGRPYVVMIIGFVAGVILSKYKVAEQEIKWAMWASILGGVLATPIGMVRGRAMSVGSIGPAGSVGEVASSLEAGSAGRVARFKSWSDTLSQIAVSRISPIRAMVRPLWFFVIMLSLALAAASGYRSAVAWVGIIYLFGIAYWGGMKSMLLSAFLGIMALVIMGILNVAFPFPPNVQRALSPFPGTWDERYVNNADNSTEWRVEMWKEALTSDEWIKNKILGDGLGFTREELERSMDLTQSGRRMGSGGLTVQQENMLISGSYHSGPVQTIRVVGYVGLFLLLLAMIRIAYSAHMLIMRAKGTPWHMVAMFFCIPIMAHPIYFVLIFGTFDESVVKCFVLSGLLDMMHRNLNLPAYEKKKKTVYQPLLVREREALQGSPHRV